MFGKINLKHLRYFYAVASEGSIASASNALHISPQTISGQIGVFEDSIGIQLFDRVGKKLIITDAGKHVLRYAEEIFALSSELEQSLKNSSFETRSLTVGTTDSIPKILSLELLSIDTNEATSDHWVCREGDFAQLLSEIAVNKLDLIISDRPVSPDYPIRAHSCFLGECGLSFYSAKQDCESMRSDFPQSLNHQAFLMPSDKSTQHRNLRSWFTDKNLEPRIAAEFDDSALMKYFGQIGHGIFCTPSIVEAHVTSQYNVEVVGRTNDIKERFYAIIPDRKSKHPFVQRIIEHAIGLFTETS